MKSSKIEDIFNFNPNMDEAKTLSPLTFYQPFQSSFDPEFASASEKTCTNYLPSENPVKRWNQAPDQQPGVAEDTRKENRNRRDQESKNSISMVGCSSSSWRPKLERQNLSKILPCPNLPVTAEWTPRQSFPARAKDEAGFSFESFDLWSGFPGRGCRGGSSNGDLQTSGFPGFGSTSHLDKVTSAGEAIGSAPACHSLMLSSFDKDLYQKVYKSGHNRPRICNFCKNNKEVPDIYLNHYLYDPETKVLTCPVLRKHVCEICGGTGDRAHTLQYCPVNRERGLQAKVPVLLKTRTITNSTGKIRRN